MITSYRSIATNILIMIIISFGIIYTASANVWDQIKDCFSDDYCNCGDSNKYVRESWNGINYGPDSGEISRGTKNHACPPWGKGDGRNNHTCLIKQDYPDKWIGYYENLCAESVKESGYFDPKIRVRGQQCSFAACWTTSNVLNWNGECVTLASGYGLPLLRMCARVAVPADQDRGLPADPGYTYGVHLNYEGATVDDPVIVGSDGNPVLVDPPKLCLYKDPSFLSTQDSFDIDLMDLNPYKQSFHKTTQTHPIVQALIFMLSMAEQFAVGISELIGTLFDKMVGGSDSGDWKVKNLGDLFRFLADVIKWVADGFIYILSEIGQINRAVDSHVYGCVLIPLGPYPPPFCPKIAPFDQVASVYRICRKDSSGDFIPSTQSEPCVISDLDNNSIRNSVRVSYDNFVPLCKTGQTPGDKCVTIDAIDGMLASVVHLATAKRDYISKCSSSSAPDALCVNTTISDSCSVAAHGCNNGFRIVYGTQIGSTLMPSGYFEDDLDDCTGSNDVCQRVWGVNTGEFIDVSLVFPAIQEESDLLPLATTLSIRNKNGIEQQFYASIVRYPSFDPITETSQEPNQICVFVNNEVLGCIDRAPLPKPLVYSCDNSAATGVSCTSDFFVPKFIASILDGNDRTSAIVKPENIYESTTVNGEVNLAGYSFESFVTDDSYSVKPFAGPKALNPSSLFGTYKNDIYPISGDTFNADAVYLYGLEYVNGSYHFGGKKACLSNNLTSGKCPIDTKKCVLTNLIGRDLVSCKTFFTKSTQYTNLALCSSLHTGCAATDSIAGKNGGAGIIIYACSGGQYCYGNSSNTEVCKVSSAAADRYLPAPSIGETLSESDYYDVGSTSSFGYNYDKDLYALRDKTAMENNACVEVPQGVCAEVTYYSEEDGFASWPETTVGQEATGTCQSGLNPVAPLKRYCVPFPDTRSFGFELLYQVNSSGNRVYSNVKCQ